eukprot:c17604_g1_i3.p1 GENE.c17604_g1_i3~~c17604_g1_i3.p1  ORF type:complete len:389 (+),score=91.77 c17604_g1_i3:19-1185(+)
MNDITNGLSTACKGWLAVKKRGRAFFGATEKRYFVLRGASLSGYAKYAHFCTQKAPLISINLNEYTVEKSGTTLLLVPSNAEANSEQELLAPTENDAENWFDHLQPLSGSLTATQNLSFWSEVDKTMPHAAKGLLGATEAPDDREELASIQITSETGETSTVLQSLIQLQKSGTVLPQSFPEWEEQDMRTLLNTITEAHRFLEVNHIEPRRNLMLWGRHAFSLVQRAFEARELIDGRVIFLASLYVQLMGRTTNALEIQAMDWVQELKMAEKNSMSEDFIHDLTQQIGKVQREIEQTGAELRFHTLIGVTIVHVLSQFLVFTQRELGIVLCYLAWIQDIGTFETLLQHCNEQLQNIDVHLRLNREQAQAITPELLTVDHTDSLHTGYF